MQIRIGPSVTGLGHSNRCRKSLCTAVSIPRCRSTPPLALRRSVQQTNHSPLRRFVPLRASTNGQQEPSKDDEIQRLNRQIESLQGLVEAAKRVMGICALAAFTLMAWAVKEQATSPIVPPLIPSIHTLASAPAAGQTSSRNSRSAPLQQQYAPSAGTAEAVHSLGTATPDTEAAGVNPDAVSHASAAAPGAAGSGQKAQSSRVSRGILQVLWGTVTLPVKLVDVLLFPDVELVRPASTAPVATTSPLSAKPTAAHQQPSQHMQSAASGAAAAAASAASHSLTAAQPAATPAGAGPSCSSTTSSIPSPGDRAVAAQHALLSVAQQVQAVASQLQGELHQLGRAVNTQQQPGGDLAQQQLGSSAAAQQHAGALAVLRALVGGGDSCSSGLLPVLVVTVGTAVAGVVLAAMFASVAGAVDKRRAMSPAQRAAEAALLDSPLRPISCPTLPGFQHYLPSDIAISYRWREWSPFTSSSSSVSSSRDGGDDDTATAISSSGVGAEVHSEHKQQQSIGSAGTGTAAAASGLSTSSSSSSSNDDDDEGEEEESWWCMGQAAAYHLLPVLRKPPHSTGSSSKARMDSAPAGRASAGSGGRSTSDSNPINSPAAVQSSGEPAATEVPAKAASLPLGSEPAAAAAAAAAATTRSGFEDMRAAAAAAGDAPASEVDRVTARSTATGAHTAAFSAITDALAAVGELVDTYGLSSTPQAAAARADRAENEANWWAAEVMGPAWETAVQIVACNRLLEPELSTRLIRRFAEQAPIQLLTKVVGLIPAAVVNSSIPAAGSSSSSSSQQVPAEDVMETTVMLLCDMLVAQVPDDEAGLTGKGRFMEVCVQMGLLVPTSPAAAEYLPVEDEPCLPIRAWSHLQHAADVVLEMDDWVDDECDTEVLQMAASCFVQLSSCMVVSFMLLTLLEFQPHFGFSHYSKVASPGPDPIAAYTVIVPERQLLQWLNICSTRGPVGQLFLVHILEGPIGQAAAAILNFSRPFFPAYIRNSPLEFSSSNNGRAVTAADEACASQASLEKRLSFVAGHLIDLVGLPGLALPNLADMEAVYTAAAEAELESSSPAAAGATAAGATEMGSAASDASFSTTGSSTAEVSVDAAVSPDASAPHADAARASSGRSDSNGTAEYSAAAATELAGSTADADAASAAEHQPAAAAAATADAAGVVEPAEPAGMPAGDADAATDDNTAQQTAQEFAPAEVATAATAAAAGDAAEVATSAAAKAAAPSPAAACNEPGPVSDASSATGAADMQAAAGGGFAGSTSDSAAGMAAGAAVPAQQQGAMTGSQGDGQLAGKEADQDATQLLASVKELLGMQADVGSATTIGLSSSRTTSSAVPNRLVLLLCQAMLMRGEEAERQLRAAVGYLAVSKNVSQQLPVMLASCLEALFPAEEWDRPGSTVKQLLHSLSSSLPAGSYTALQKQLMAKGLLKELDVPINFAE